MIDIILYVRIHAQTILKEVRYSRTLRVATFLKLDLYPKILLAFSDIWKNLKNVEKGKKRMLFV